jgi:hypothetical protein
MTIYQAMVAIVSYIYVLADNMSQAFESLHGQHFLVPGHSLRFQHKGTCFGTGSWYSRTPLAVHVRYR